MITAANMVPGKSYRGTAEGPEKLDGVCFTVLATVSTMAEGGVVPYDADFSDGDVCLLQVLYDAYGYPFPEASHFSPGDIVEEMSDYGIVGGAVFTFGWTRIAKCEGCRIQLCEIEGNTLTPCTCGQNL